MHAHFSGLSAINTFLAVLVVGTVWRLGSYRLAACDSAAARSLGQAMAFQY